MPALFKSPSNPAGSGSLSHLTDGRPAQGRLASAVEQGRTSRSGSSPRVTGPVLLLFVLSFFFPFSFLSSLGLLLSTIEIVLLLGLRAKMLLPVVAQQSKNLKEEADKGAQEKTGDS